VTPVDRVTDGRIGWTKRQIADTEQMIARKRGDAQYTAILNRKLAAYRSELSNLTADRARTTSPASARTPAPRQSARPAPSSGRSKTPSRAPAAPKAIRVRSIRTPRLPRLRTR
jgi:hypothetical protein